MTKMPKENLSIEQAFDLAVQHHQNGNFQEAEIFYTRILKTNPNHYQSLGNLGFLATQLKKYDASKKLLETTIQINPYYAEAHNNLGNVYYLQGKHQQAIICYQKALKLNPNVSKFYSNLGNLFQDLGKFGKAINLYDQALVLNPDNLRASSNRETALHLLNSQAGVTTKTASEDYIKTLFDDYAKRFDHHLTTILGYKVPQFLINSLYALIGSDLIFDNVIDLGCGTGLSGKEFRPISKRLVGIDLSSKMIEIAEGKKIYDLIENIEVNKYLETKSEKYDLFIATDLLIYVGDPTQLFSNISKTSKSKAIFLFSTESTQDKDYILTNQGRYAHSEEYIRQLVKLNKFTILNVENATIRKGIEGHLFILRYLG